MITHDDLNHHLRREREERARAHTTTNSEAQRAHLQLAESHARRASNARIFLDRQETQKSSAELVAK